MKIFLGLLMGLLLLSQVSLAAEIRVATVKILEVTKNWKDLQGLPGGTIEVDQDKNEVKLCLYRDGASLADVVTILPITSTRVEACNVKVFEAMRDRTKLDGPKETILIRDYTSSRCSRGATAPLTRITYTEVGGWTSKAYQAQFEAGPLR